MEGPANTITYLIGGLAVVFGVMAVYLVSLVSRWRNLRQDEEVLQKLDTKQ